MAFPTVAAETSSSEPANTTTHTVAMPSGSGGTLLTILGFDARPIVSGQIPDNWAGGANTAASGDQCALRTYTLPGGSGGASQTITTDAGQCSGHYTARLDGASAFETAVFQGTTGSSWDPPSLNPAGWDAEDTLWFAVSVNDDGTVTATAFPTNYTNTGQVNAGDAADGVTLAWGRRELNAASEDPGAFTGSAVVPFCTALVAVRPVSPVAHVATGAKSAGSATATSIAYPGSIAAGQMILAFRSGWRSDIAMADESGWTNTAQLGGGTGTAIDAHTTKIRVDRKEAAGSESGSVTFDQSGSTNPGCLGIMVSYAKNPSSATWDVATTTGDDATHGTNRSVTGSGTLDFQPGDVLVAGVATDTDANLASFGSAALTASGITFSAATRRSPASAGVNTGDDGNVEVIEATVTAGTGTVAPTLAFNTTTNQCGPVAFVRLRAVTAVALAPADSAQAQTTDGATLTQDHTLVVADAAQGQTADEVAVTQLHLLAVADTAQGQTADGATVDVVVTLAPADAAQAQTADSAVLTQAHALQVADSGQTQASESPALTQAHNLVSGDTSQAQSADGVTVAQVHALAPADTGQAQGAESPTLTQVHALAVADTLQGQVAEEPTVIESGPEDLTVADTGQAQTADGVVLAQVHVLAAADTVQGQTADALVLAQTHVLVPVDTTQGQAAEAVLLGQVHLLVVADARQTQAADTVLLGAVVIPDQADHSQGTWDSGGPVVYDGGVGALVYEERTGPLTYDASQ